MTENKPSQCAGSQVGVFMLELPIQGQASLLPVVGEEGGQGVDFAERRTRRNHIAVDKAHTNTRLHTPWLASQLCTVSSLPSWEKRMKGNGTCPNDAGSHLSTRFQSVYVAHFYAKRKCCFGVAIITGNKNCEHSEEEQEWVASRVAIWPIFPGQSRF